MFHYASNPYFYPTAPMSNPRDRYLAALAEAKVAEAEFLSAEAARREEDDLRRRLQEIQHQRLLRSAYDRDPLSHIDSYSTYGHLAGLRQQVQAEERLALREAERRRRLEATARDAEARLLRQAREKAVLRQRDMGEQSRLAALVDHSTKVAQHHCSCGNQVYRHPCFNLGPQRRFPFTQTLMGLEGGVSLPEEANPQAESDFVEVLSKLLSNALVRTNVDASASAQPAVPRRNSVQQKTVSAQQKSVEQLFKAIGVPIGSEQQHSSSINPKDGDEANLLQQFANLFSVPAPKPATSSKHQEPEAPVAPSAAPTQPSNPSLSSDSSTASLKEQLEARLNNEYHSEVRDTIQAIVASLQGTNTLPATNETQPSNPPSSSDSSTASLKERLEARFNNEYHTEVRDTIQAIIASLQDTNTFPTTNEAAAASSSKGKAKAEDSSSSTASRTPAPPINRTSKDVVDSLNEIRNIEAAFHTLESDFSFPTTLDFIATHLIPGSLASSDSESSSATSHLAYTPRNHPVRFYEQALSALLNQLDSVDSFGNDTLRANRKEIVSLVEKALEELENEVEARYRTRLSKEVKTGPAVPESAPVETPSHSNPIAESEVKNSSLTTTKSLEIARTVPILEVTSSEPVESSPSFIALSNAQFDAPADAPDAVDEGSSLISSSVTIKGYEVEATPATAPAVSHSESAEAFVLAPSHEKTVPKDLNNKDAEDIASDWSELEA